jgi:hypothetical protein
MGLDRFYVMMLKIKITALCTYYSTKAEETEKGCQGSSEVHSQRRKRVSKVQFYFVRMPISLHVISFVFSFVIIDLVGCL